MQLIFIRTDKTNKIVFLDKNIYIDKLESCNGDMGCEISDKDLNGTTFEKVTVNGY